jgi:pyruvate-ferredoxin/flavodoxin oxidoreductase
MITTHPVSTHTMMDGNEAVARVAYRLSEVIAIYPITPSSTMAEWTDEWASAGRPNLWGAIPSVVEMQSEGGVAGAIHGALMAGSLATTFTASQGLLLMIPNLYKIAGELTPFVVHVAARAIATHALSIFGDHSDVMAARQTGCAMLVSNSVQEAADMAAVAHAATLEARLPVMHFFDGFRTSHEVAGVVVPSDDVLRALVSPVHILRHRNRALNPEHPVLRGTAQNPDAFFQSREACNPHYLAAPSIFQSTMDNYAALTGRQYRLFEYVGAPDAEHVIISMGSSCEVVESVVEREMSEGRKVGLLKVRLYRPFSIEHFLDALPRTVRTIAVLDRCKEPGAVGEPLFLDVVGALQEASWLDQIGFEQMPRVIGGRYGLASKDFTPPMAKAVFDEMAKPDPKRRFTVGIVDDVTHLSLPVDESYSTASSKTTRAVFYGLGSDGTVGASKNTIKIIGEEAGLHAQGYFVYDSKKSGSLTVSHLRFGPEPLRTPYLVREAHFIGVHQFELLDKIDVLAPAMQGATVLINSHHGPEHTWDHLMQPVREVMRQRHLKVFVIDAGEVAREAGLGRRVNTILQACFFALSNVLPREQAMDAIRASIRKTYGRLGDEVVERNLRAVEMAVGHLHQIKIPQEDFACVMPQRSPWSHAPKFEHDVLAQLAAFEGDRLPVSAFPPDGTYPVGTSKFEKRNIAEEVPEVNTALCAQCGKCVLVCPHAAIRAKLVPEEALDHAPRGFLSAPAKFVDHKGERYVLTVSHEDCTGCGLCVEVCPVTDKKVPDLKALNMIQRPDDREAERAHWDFFAKLPDIDRSMLNHSRVKDIQLLEPLFEFSGACSGCGQTPYLKLLTQLFGDRALIANATGCSSIYGANLPTTPWTTNKDGRGPAWANSLFEDNAEFGMGMRVALDSQREFAEILLHRVADRVGLDLVDRLLSARQDTEEEIVAQRERVIELRRRLAHRGEDDVRALLGIADALVRRSVWIIGGDGWAYDIGFGGLDHVLASGRDVNVLVLDTEVYSNTGGQASKSTPRGAVARFATGGRQAAKKDLPLLAMAYGTVYVAQVCLGANDSHAIKCFLEAESYHGPSLIIAYAHCIAHGIDMKCGLNQQKAAVDSGHWPLLHFDPRAHGDKNPLHLDAKAPRLPLKDYVYAEGRYRRLTQSRPEEAERLLQEAEADITRRRALYEYMAAMGTRPMGEGEGG